MAARPYTQAEWRRSRGGFKTYQSYLSWWNRTVAPKFRNRGGAPAAQPYDFLAPMSPLERANAVNAQVEAAIGPERHAIEAARARAEAAAKAQAETMRGYGTAWAELAKPIAPAIQGAYREAGESIATFGKGFADEAARGAAADTAAVSADVSKLSGAPPEQLAQLAATIGQGGSTPMYAMGGYIPASTLAREGAAFAGAAAMLPNTALGTTNAEITRIARAAAAGDAEYADQLVALAAKIPGLRSQIENELTQLDLSKEATRINREYLGIKKLDAASSANAQALELSLPDASLSRAYGYIVDKAGRPILQNGQTIPFTPQDLERERIRISQQNADKPAGGGSDPNKPGGTADDARISFNSGARDFAKSLITKKQKLSPGGNPIPGQFTDQRPPIAEARSLIRSALSAEIAVLRRLGVSQAEINRMIDNVLRAQGWKITTAKPPVRRRADVGKPGRG